MHDNMNEREGLYEVEEGGKKDKLWVSLLIYGI